MKALVFGTDAEPWAPPPGANRLARNLAATPCALLDVPDAEPLRPDWFVIRTLLTGICGSDARQILFDFEGDSDSAMRGFCSFTPVLGHEVVAEVAVAGPEAVGFDVGQRVVLNPWLSCAPRCLAPDLTGLLTHTVGLSAWRDAFLAVADQEQSGAIEVALDTAG